MSIATILIIVLIVALICGFLPIAPGGLGYGAGHWGQGFLGLVLVVLLILVLLGRL